VCVLPHVRRALGAHQGHLQGFCSLCDFPYASSTAYSACRPVMRAGAAVSGPYHPACVPSRWLKVCPEVVTRDKDQGALGEHASYGQIFFGILFIVQGFGYIVSEVQLVPRGTTARPWEIRCSHSVLPFANATGLPASHWHKESPSHLLGHSGGSGLSR